MNKSQRRLRAQLEQMHAAYVQAMPRPGLVYAGAPDFVLQHGIWYNPGPLTYPERGAPRLCFGNSLNMAIKHPELSYVEGFAAGPGIPMPIHHAWNCTPDGALVDITWQNLGAAYLGCVFSLERADDATWHGDAAILDDYKRAYPLFRRRWEGERPIEGYEPSEAITLARRLAALGKLFTKGASCAK